MNVCPQYQTSHQAKTRYKKVVILGSGGLRIGQAGEFDYSGSQAIKALKEEGICCTLINPNIATIQTDSSMADKVYLQPLEKNIVKKILADEQPDAILLNVGGQTALNLGLELEEDGILAKQNIAVLGTAVSSIRTTEDREKFKRSLETIHVPTAKSSTVYTVDEALEAAEKMGYPVMVRAGFSLGGLGSGLVNSAKTLAIMAREALSACPHLLIEESLHGWKEIEYEIVRDADSNCITVCNMENLDPMGIHTGESIVVAPSQTLSNQEYHLLRKAAIDTANHLKIVGECNIQYALDPKSLSFRVIEVNARLSRSSALASKATGYPLAFVSTKLCLGYRLHELKNSVTKSTSVFFEPALDYVVVKMPRWDTHKMRCANRQIGSEMKSVGEVMAIGRSFPEALQKAVRMQTPGSTGLGDQKAKVTDPESMIRTATDQRLQAIYQALCSGITVEQIALWSHIDPWFLHQLQMIADWELQQAAEPLSKEPLLKAKQLGFSDARLAELYRLDEADIRRIRMDLGVRPVIRQIDTLAGEVTVHTNYLFVSYHGQQSDLATSTTPAIIVLGSGPYCIGSSVEFDWCAVNTARTLQAYKKPTIIINSNPETVSTDYDESDRLYFEELTLERILDITDFESPFGVIVSTGGQIANNLALPLAECGVPLMGTAAKNIDRAENRKLFSALCQEKGIDQPTWQEVKDQEQARQFAKKVGYPLLVRPSYVLSGAAMNVVYSDQELNRFLQTATHICPKYPTVISQFIQNAKELEVDGIAKQGEVVIYAISEHVENAGVHSGDATIVLPPQRLYLETIRRTKKITRQIVEALQITGPFNIQFIAIDNTIKVIECNVRASRSLPFVSKVTGHNFIEISTEVLLGIHKKQSYQTLELDYVGVKTPLFSFNRLKGANPVSHVEMASTGEVACIADNYLEAFFASWLATEQSIKGKRILLSIKPDAKRRLVPLLQKLESMGWELWATEGTHEFLCRNGIGAAFCYKDSAEREPSVRSLLANKFIDLVVNLPSGEGNQKDTDGYKMRRLAIDHHIPLLTNPQQAQLFLTCLTELSRDQLSVKSWQQYTKKPSGI